jgi:geranylgeranyl reductase family protein
MNRPPVVIAGGGPAGCAAAIALHRLGQRTVILDRAFFPREKVCGDVLLPAALDALRSLGCDTAIIERRGTLCTGARYSAPSGRSFAGEFTTIRREPAPWLVLERRVFDAWLLDEARSAGAEVREGTEVTGVIRDRDGFARGVTVRRRSGAAGRAGGQRIEAAAVIGADGASSIVARALGAATPAPRHLGIAVRGYATGVRLSGPWVEVYTTASILPGCCWIVPTGPDSCNVGAGVIRKDAIVGGLRYAGLLDQLRETVPAFARRLSGGSIRGVKGWILPMMPAPRQRAGRGWLLAGDAAALIDPLTGHGIHNALVAGRRAGETLSAALEAGDLSERGLAGYDAAIRTEMIGEARRGWVIQRMHAVPLLAEAMALAGSRSRSVCSRLVTLIGHGSSRAALLRPWPRLGGA